MAVLSPRLRTMMGFITIAIYGMIGLLAWPRLMWLTAICGLLALVRLGLLIRQWPRAEAAE